MKSTRPLTASARGTIAALVQPSRVESMHPMAARFVYGLRLIALHDRAKRDPVPELAVRLGSVEVAAKALSLAHAISASWPENIHVSRFCCKLMSHDETTIAAMVEAAMRRDRRAFDAAIEGLVRPDRHERLWDRSLALVAAEMQAL